VEIKAGTVKRKANTAEGNPIQYSDESNQQYQDLYFIMLHVVQG
jgi:hypothetical protein